MLKKMDPRKILFKCIDLTLDLVQLCFPIFQQMRVRGRIEHPVDDVDSEVYREKIGLSRKIHIESFEILSNIRRNPVTWGMLDSPRQEVISNTLQRFCSVQNYFFESLSGLGTALRENLGFCPSGICAEVIPFDVTNILDEAISTLLPSLLPPDSFLLDREAIATRMEAALRISGIFPPGEGHVCLFGSSRNGFGSPGSDVDMCLFLSEGNKVTMTEKQATVAAMGQVLITAGMEEVQVRATSRIPIILFKDPASGLDCDLSLHNALAIRNTDLLLTYSCLDHRVRSLAYVIKRWARHRKMNSPGDGTLSSYGFVLCLIHYLQIIEVPILPNLQGLPSDWDGEVLSGKPVDQVNFDISITDNTPCNTYFLKPTQKQFTLLQNEAKKNKMTTSELLFGFFEYYAWKFDYRRDIVSINMNRFSPQPMRANMKLYKAEIDCWSIHDRLSIEDPFESFYNVAHVIKPVQMAYIRREFLRAHTLLARCLLPGQHELLDDILPARVAPVRLLDLLFEIAPSPSFMEQDSRKKNDVTVIE
jgi:DNA polymerase sigma